jgi:esterase/lipase superfamily enzyme/GNAT superfamily N-acetyltransferase
VPPRRQALGEAGGPESPVLAEGKARPRSVQGIKRSPRRSAARARLRREGIESHRVSRRAFSGLDQMPSLNIPSFYEYLEERPFNGAPSPRRRNVEGQYDPTITLRALEESYPTTYPWWKARTLEGRADASDAEGIWGISAWRVEKYLGDPTAHHIARDCPPANWPARVGELARLFRLHHYFRVWTAEECRNYLRDIREVRVAVEVTEEWHDPPDGVVSDPPPGSPTLGAHAIPIVEYDPATDRFLFPNSWGERWGHQGGGSISTRYIDTYLVEGWCRVAAGILPPIKSRNGLIKLLWKSSAGGQEVHGREIVDAESGDHIAWAFARRRGNYFDIEELFVWPAFRRQGHGRKLVELLKELSRGAGLPLRAWVSFADCEQGNRAALLRTLHLLGLHLHPSPQRSAGFLALPDRFRSELPEPRIPPRAASVRARLRPDSGTRLYTVWYGTNRKPIDPPDPSSGFSGERDNQVHYGKCEVAIPRSHKFGSVGSAWWRRWVRLTDDRLRIVSRMRHTSDEFWSDLRSVLRNYPDDERQALIFLHGYRVRFDRAAIRAAQIGFDLKVPGVTAFFSWPSRGSTFHYPGDGESIQASESAIADFLRRFVHDSGATRVHLIAHSMGNRGLLRAIHRITAALGESDQIRFGQIILAAPDIDHDVFCELATVYPRVSDRTTLYVSPSDLAVGWSRWLHDHPRVGLTPPVTVVDGIDTVEVPRFDLTSLKWHSYFAEAEGLLHDLFDLIRWNPDPGDRQRLTPAETEKGARYWVMT